MGTVCFGCVAQESNRIVEASKSPGKNFLGPLMKGFVEEAEDDNVEGAVAYIQPDENKHHPPRQFGTRESHSNVSYQHWRVANGIR